MFGFHMFYQTLQNDGELAIAGILAHEFGHRAQFHLDFTFANKRYLELEADAFAGYYMAIAKQYSWNNMSSFFNAMYRAGSSNYNSLDHHGTPNQRLAAAYFGVQVALEAMRKNTPLSYNDLHNIFTYEIENVIAFNKSNNSFEEIKYPNITDEERVALFPFKEL